VGRQLARGGGPFPPVQRQQGVLQHRCVELRPYVPAGLGLHRRVQRFGLRGRLRHLRMRELRDQRQSAVSVRLGFQRVARSAVPLPRCAVGRVQRRHLRGQARKLGVDRSWRRLSIET
jgi:hypothetical protein